MGTIRQGERHTIALTTGSPITVIVQRDRRLKKSARWVRGRDGSILLRVPYHMKRHHLEPLLKDVERQLERQQTQARRRTHDDLQARAEAINRRCFGGRIEWQAIRWVGNMEKRLGSCTNGGPTDGHIRISERIRNWPEWVVDYVIAHELAHRVHSNHSREFWDFLQVAYPLTERARGFIMGMGFAEGETLDEDEM